MLKKLICCFILIAAIPALARESGEPDVPWEKLRDTAQRYLDACCPPSTTQRMSKKMQQVVDQRMRDNDTLSEDVCMRSIMLDWAAGNEGNLKRKEKDAVEQACFYFVNFYDKGYDVPQQIRAKLTHETVKEILDHLEGEIARAGKSSDKK